MALGTKRKAAQRLSVNPVSLPSGAVQEFAGASAPEGWLMCDGAEVSKTTYAALYAVIADTYGTPVDSNNFVLPDLRGEFVRGLDDMGTAQGARGVDSGRALGSAQNQATAVNGLGVNNDTHNHNINDPGHSHTNNFTGTANVDIAAGSQFNRLDSNSTSSSTTGITINNDTHNHSLSGDAETRPRNCAMNFIIKA